MRRAYIQEPLYHLNGCKLLTSDQLRTLGRWGSADQRRNKSTGNYEYLRYPFKKKGVTRVGIFGGSQATFGGVSKTKGYSYPAILREIFKERSQDRIEVINFANEYYALFQQHKLWEFVGQKYDLDCVIYTMHDNHIRRDLVFYDIKGQEPLHSRYILHNNKLQVVSPHHLKEVGSNEKEGVKHNFIPPLSFLFYNKNMPLFLRAILPENLHSRTNPFYYRPFVSDKVEAYPIYGAILDATALKVKNVIMFVQQEDVSPLKSFVKRNNVFLYAPKADALLKSFLYLEDEYHFNGLGNIIRAKEIEAYLTGEAKWGMSLVETFYLNSVRNRDNLRDVSLDRYRSISLKVKDYSIASLRNADFKVFDARRSLGRDVKRREIKSLLLVYFKENQRYCIIPLKMLIKSNQKVRIAFKNDKKDSYYIGRLDKWSDSFGVVIVNKGIDLSFVGHKYVLEITDSSLIKQGSVFRGNPEIIIDEDIVLDLSWEKDFLSRLFDKFSAQKPVYRFVLQDLESQRMYLCVNDLRFLEDGLFQKEGRGVIDLSITTINDVELRVPLFAYKVNSMDMVVDEPYNFLLDNVNFSLK